MEQFLANLAAYNDVVNTFIWTTLGLVLLLSTGLLTTIAVNARGHHPHGMIGDNSVIVDYILKHS